MQTISIHILFVNTALKYALRSGCNTARLLRKSGIPANLLQIKNARVSAEQFAKLLSSTALAMNDGFLGYTGNREPVATTAAACHWFVQSPSLGAALRKLCKFYNRPGHDLQPQLSITGDEVQIELSHANTAYEPYTYELLLFNLHRFCCWLTDENLPVTGVHLTYPAPLHSDEYRMLFLGKPVCFSAARCYISFQRSVLSRPIKQNSQSLKRFMKNPFLELFTSHREDDSWATRIKNAIGSDLKTIPPFIEIAARLNIHPKKLNRLLTDEGVSYMAIKNQLRRDTAIYYLSKRHLSVEEIAFETGFSEASSLIKAFKKWTGVTPYTYKNKAKE